MKFLFIVFFIPISIYAQETESIYNPVKVDLMGGLGFSFAGGNSSILISVEPKYALNDNVTLGLRFEFIHLKVTDRYIDHLVFFYPSTSIIVTADHYFNYNKWKPVGGIGIGVYNIGSGYNTSSIGILPRIGLETEKFRTALEINLPFAGRSESLGYLGIKAGYILRNKKRE
jgi:hypothetical protein